MNISYVDYSPATKSLDIFFSGCNPPFCSGCYNSELSDFNCGTDWRNWIDKIEKYCNEYSGLIDNIFLLGGSPAHQDLNEMYEFIRILFILINQKIWLFAREELNEIPELFIKTCDYIKSGAYIPELKCDDNIINVGKINLKLATSNQKVYIKDKDY